MSGMVSFNAKASLPPGQKPFLKKVELQGDFPSYFSSDVFLGATLGYSITRYEVLRPR
jgi:hypothetical protein